MMAICCGKRSGFNCSRKELIAMKIKGTKVMKNRAVAVVKGYLRKMDCSFLFIAGFFSQLSAFLSPVKKNCKAYALQFFQLSNIL